jgi:2-oxoacid:acceptor oxidoreductase gamma subunit (pyruvate/2-ketoisovalerate family)
MNENKIVKIAILGRGGQGVVTCAEVLAEAAYLSGNYEDVHAYPSFGAERRGAPVQAYAKLSHKEKIWDRAQIEHPDILIIFDESVMNIENVSSLQSDGTLIINSEKGGEFFREKFKLKDSNKVIVADISTLSLKKQLTIDGSPVVNTPILGLLLKALPHLTLQNLETVLNKRMDESIARVNFELIKEGNELAKMI